MAQEEFRRYIWDLCHYFRRIMADEYQIDLDFGVKMARDVMAKIVPDPVYLSARIKISQRMYEEFKQKHYTALADTLAHEFAHILTQPLKETAMEDRAPSRVKFIDNMAETQTQRIARAVMLLVPEGVYNPEKRRNGDDTKGILREVRGSDEAAVGSDPKKE